MVNSYKRTNKSTHSNSCAVAKRNEKYFQFAAWSFPCVCRASTLASPTRSPTSAPGWRCLITRYTSQVATRGSSNRPGMALGLWFVWNPEETLIVMIIGFTILVNLMIHLQTTLTSHRFSTNVPKKLPIVLPKITIDSKAEQKKT